MAIKHAEDIYDKVESKTVPVPRRGMMQLAPGQGADGYGRKIATDYMVRFNGKGPWLRVYCCCYSNSGTLYALVNKEWVCFHNDENLRLTGEWPLEEHWAWHAKFEGLTVEEWKAKKRAELATA